MRLQVPVMPSLTKSTKVYKLFIDGVITLTPIPLGQTYLTITASVDLLENEQSYRRRMKLGTPPPKNQAIGRAVAATDSRARKPTTMVGNGLGIIKKSISVTLSSAAPVEESASTRPKAAKPPRQFAAGAKAEDIFCKITGHIYDHFQKEEVIDARRRAAFIDYMLVAPPLTDAERILIVESMELVKKLTAAKRITKTVAETAQKFIHHPEGGGAAWGKSVTDIHVAAVELFAELWVLDTYAKLAENKDKAIRQVWYNLDGTRSLQYVRSASLPGGFQDRLFEVWITWDAFTDADGRHTYVMAATPFENYVGTHHEVPGSENMIQATTRGVHIVRELTENTCEWTRVQQGDLNITGLPRKVLDFVAKQQLGAADVMKEKFRRNGLEVDREGEVALIDVMKKRRGFPLMEDQAETVESCIALLGDVRDGSGGGWTKIESPSHEVEMKMQYFPPKKGERSVGTGKAVGVVDCSAEEVRLRSLSPPKHFQFVNVNLGATRYANRRSRRGFLCIIVMRRGAHPLMKATQERSR